jgi:hypothetical protein
MYLIFTALSKVKETTLAISTRLLQVVKSQNSNNVAVTVVPNFGAKNDYIKCVCIVALRNRRIAAKRREFQTWRCARSHSFRSSQEWFLLCDVNIFAV